MALSFGLMAVAVALAIYLVIAYENLSDTVTAQRTQIARNRALLDRQAAEIEQKQGQLVTSQFATLYVDDQLYGLLDFGDRLESICVRRIPDPYVTSFCDTQEPSSKILSRFNGAIRARLAAATAKPSAQPEAYQNAKSAYGDAAAYMRGRPVDAWQKGWLARSLEGIAYSDMKLGNLAEAASVISTAEQLDPHSAIVGSTLLKVLCLQKADGDEIRAKYRALIGRLDRRVTAAPDPARSSTDQATEKRNAVVERNILVRDPELFFLCRDTGISAAAPDR